MLNFDPRDFYFEMMEVKASVATKCYADGPGSAWTEIVWDQGQDMPEGFQRSNPVNDLFSVWKEFTGYESRDDFFESLQGLAEAPEDVQEAVWPKMEAEFEAVKTAIQKHITKNWAVCLVNGREIGYCLK